jgi:hypothetical protein
VGAQGQIHSLLAHEVGVIENTTTDVRRMISGGITATGGSEDREADHHPPHTGRTDLGALVALLTESSAAAAETKNGGG